MRFETKELPDDAGYELWVEGKWFDRFESVHVLADAVAQLLIFAADPMSADWINGLINAEVVRTPQEGPGGDFSGGEPQDSGKGHSRL